MQKIRNLEDAMQRLRGYLTQYLSEKGIDTSRNFNCINPKHQDSNPSMTCQQSKENAFCFGCLSTVDVFQAAHWLDGKPITGSEFIEQNVKWLADKYGVELELQEMSEDDMYRARTYQAYRDAALLVANRKFGSYEIFDKEVERRGWDKDFLQEKMIGTVDFKEFREALKSMGYEARFLDDIDLGRDSIFDSKNMIFTICDEVGRPVGFSARNLAYTNDQNESGKPKNGSKYINQMTTGVRCNIYQKGKRLYELHTAKTTNLPIYIFEGYSDVITAQKYGLFNCVAIGGTAFTSQQIEILKKIGCYNIILCFDGDQAGREATINSLDKYFTCQKDIQISVVNMPEGKNPKDIIKEEGVEAFIALKKWSAFEWRLACYGDDENPEDICKNMIPLIVGETSHIVQDRMCGELSKFTGIDKKLITQELNRLTNEKERDKQREKDIIIEQALSECKNNPVDSKIILTDCIRNLERVEEKYNDNNMSSDSVLEFIDSEKRYQDNKPDAFAGFKLAEWGLGMVGNNLNGDWKEDVLCAFGGSENAGKSTLMCQLAWEIASIEENNAIVIYHTIDDSKEQILPKFVCQAYGHTDLTINQIKNINYYRKHDELLGEALAVRRDTGYQNLRDIVKSGRLIIKDITDGASLAYGESLVTYLRSKNPSKKIVYIIDNLHKASDFEHKKDERVKFKAISNQMKNMATTLHVCCIATVEYKKLQARQVPNNNDIAETRALKYDANLIVHLYNDMHECASIGEEPELFHEYEGRNLPRIRLGFGKNKITDFKDRVFLDFFPASGIFRPVDTGTAVREWQARKKLIKQMQADLDDKPKGRYKKEEEDNND